MQTAPHLNAPCYIMSDAHLGFARDDVERAVIGFLRHVASHAGSLVVNGDLFEFWFEWRTVIPRRGFRTLAALADVVDAGVPVTMIAGNHDCWGGEVLRRDVGLDYRFGPLVADVAGWRTHIEHGDGLRPREDRRYRALRRLLRNPLAIRSFRWLHPDMATPLASHSSNASRSYSARDGGRGLRDAAERVASGDRSLDLIVFGHSHVSTLEQLPGGTAYGNPGSWLDAPTFLRVSDGRVALRRWDGSAESPDLHALDRSAKKALA
ncbi:MAG TPA: UDP-2,3-diacylglucosamine diphosphatase [Gemmatimonadaceae bacterium]|nr:UDP-2,3-diacylglucosamine diphosphatase [Gemmatimonadaceae bacterium]